MITLATCQVCDKKIADYFDYCKEHYKEIKQGKLIKCSGCGKWKKFQGELCADCAKKREDKKSKKCVQCGAVWTQQGDLCIKCKLQNLGRQGEERFKELLENGNYPYMYIHQDQISFSKGMAHLDSKRPDFLVVIPEVGALFFDAKAYKISEFYDYGSTFQGININRDDFERLKKLQHLTSIKVWYAIIPHHNFKLRPNCYTIPLSRVKAFDLGDKKLFDQSRYIQVPLNCFNDSSKSLSIENKCNECSDQLCQEIRNRNFDKM